MCENSEKKSKVLEEVEISQKGTQTWKNVNKAKQVLDEIQKSNRKEGDNK